MSRWTRRLRSMQIDVELSKEPVGSARRQELEDEKRLLEAGDTAEAAGQLHRDAVSEAMADFEKELARDRIRCVAELVLPTQLAQHGAEEAAERSMLQARAIVAKWEEMEKCN